MHVGFGTFFQNLGSGESDERVWRAELELTDRAERLGFGSVWTVEHHFSGYSMSPNPLQLLSWAAARTEHVKLGSMVCVLPWHDPVRLAEGAAMLDHLSGGRLLLGVGRGLARTEFEGFRVEMGESRRLFAEQAEAILESFDTGTLAHDGELYRQPPVAIRPAPLAPLRGRTYASSISPESAEVMARLGVGAMLFLQKPWEQTIADVSSYADRFREVNGADPPKPLMVILVACGADRAQAAERFEHVKAYYRSTIDHYEFDDGSLAEVPGYEYYGRIAETIRKHGADEFARFLAELQPSGTPEEVAEGIAECVRKVDAAGVVAVCSYGGMAPESAAANQELFAREVLPALREIDAGPEIGAAPAAAPLSA